MNIDIGIVTGVIGSITGIAGFIMGLIAFRHSKEIKAADRRLDLEKLRNETVTLIQKLNDTMPKALGSKRANLAASGLSGSSYMDQFTKQHQIDTSEIKSISNSSQILKEDFKKLKRDQLETRIVELDKIKLKVNDLHEKYESSLKEDKDHAQQRRP
ncbi:MAG: hypothetical protein GY820_46775 [Gammaproteobacteria bacterium]|nr:hypothetical protein [Gammaproteobacteria bacterium]